LDTQNRGNQLFDYISAGHLPSQPTHDTFHITPQQNIVRVQVWRSRGPPHLPGMLESFAFPKLRELNT